MNAAIASSHVHAPRSDARRVRKRRNNFVALAALSIVFAALLGAVYHVLTSDSNSGASKGRGERGSAASKSEPTRDKKIQIAKKSQKSGTSLPPLSAFDPNKKPVDEVKEPVSTLPAQSQEVFAEWMADADKAIRENRVADALAVLDRYLRYGDAPRRAYAESLHKQCLFATIGKEDAAFLLSQMQPEQLRALEQGILEVSIDGLKFTHATLEQAFYTRLREHAAAQKKGE